MPALNFLDYFLFSRYPLLMLHQFNLFLIFYRNDALRKFPGKLFKVLIAL